MTTPNHYPNDRPDPTQLIVTAGAPRVGLLRDTLQQYADQLTTFQAFADVTARDAHAVAAIITWDVLHGGEATGLRQRAAVINRGYWGVWDNPLGVARAFQIAATVLDAL